MATAAQNPSLPLFYTALEALNLTQHGKMKVRPIEKAEVIAKTHAIPATVDEFTLLQRHFPIVFSVGDQPIPLVLMGLSEGVNVFLDDDGKPCYGEVTTDKTTSRSGGDAMLLNPALLMPSARLLSTFATSPEWYQGLGD